MKLTVNLILAGLCLVTLASPVKRAAENKCAAECSGTSSKFRYQTGKSYNYQYETEAKVKLAGVSQNEAAVKIEANVQISALAPCEFTLKLTQVKITGLTTADLGSDWTQELQKHVTRFSFDDGKVSGICPKAEEKTWAVNIKRAILSAFQNAQAGRTDNVETYEEDVSGRCPTNFVIKDEAGAKIITKTKKLISCFKRMGASTSLRFIPYEVHSATQSNPTIDANQKCIQSIKDGILNDTTCEEKHIYKQFNNADKGGIIVVSVQKLTYVNGNGNVAQGEPGPRQKLYFDHKELEHSQSKQAVGDARQNLKDICRTSQNEVRPETPSLFNELVYNLRKLSLDDLKALHQEATPCEFGKQSLLNALPMGGTTATVSLVADILKNNINQLTTIQKRVYFTSFALVPHVKKEMITAVTPLIDSVPKEGLLGISTLVHTHCREYPSCAEHAEVKAVLSKLTETLGAKCTATNDETRDAIVYTLKALGNIGHSTESVEKRVNCLKEKTNPIDIRLAAVQSLRRVPCAARVAPLQERFADPEEDVEVRLTSFLTYIKCATPEIVNKVKEILEREQIHQVGSFVRTYFEQVAKSSDPSNHEIQNLLSSAYISKRFNSDPRKYSRFYEASQFSSKLNFGGHAESALIFTPNGYAPRQGFLNLTLDAFGNSFNLLEIGGRAEGLEKLTDDLFGPNGYFTNPTGFYFKPQKKPHKNPKVVELQDKFDKGIKKNPNLDLSWYIRIFGDEIAYKNLRNVNLMDQYTKALGKVMASLKSSQEVNVKVARANQLISHYASFPTASGLPLHVAGNVTIAVNVEFIGKLDLSKLMKQRNAELRASLKPSAAVDRSFMFAIHAGNSKFGVRLQEVTHSSTAANFLVELKNGEAFKSSLELPKQKNEILQYDIKLFTIKNNVPIEEPGITQDRVSGKLCTPERLNRWVGLKICHEAAFANATSVPDAPYFPLTGPVRYAVTLEKTDPQLKNYEFSASWKNTPTSRAAKLSFNTPGSTVDREISIDYDYQRGRSLNLKFKSPLKKIDAIGTLESTGQVQKGQIKIKVDDAKEYTLIGTQERQPSANGGKTTYSGEIVRPGQQPVKLSAVDNLELPQSGLFKRTFDLKADNLFASPVEFKSVVERTGQRQGKIHYDLKSPKLNSKVTGKITLEGDIRSAIRLADDTVKSEFDWSIEYQRPRVDQSPHKVDIKYNLDYARQGPTLKLEETLKTKCNTHLAYNLDYHMKAEKSPEKLGVKFQAVDGSGTDLNFELTANKNQADNKHSGKTSIKSAKLGLDHKADFTYQNNLPRQLTATVKLDTPQTKDIRSEIKYSSNAGQDVEGEAKLSYPGRDLRIYKKLQRVDASKFKSKVILQWQRDKQLQLDSDVTFDKAANHYELKTVASGVDAWTFNQKVKVGADQSVNSAVSLQKGTQTIYDWKLDITSDGPKKQKLQSHFKSSYGSNVIDVSTSGSIEDTGNGRKVVFTSKKGQSDLLKGELIIPKALPVQDPQTHVKVSLGWDRSAVLVDYQCAKAAADQLLVSTALKLDLPTYGSPINRKLSLKIFGTDTKSVNFTWFKDNAPLVEGGYICVRKPAAGGYEASVGGNLKTFEPWAKRDIKGEVKYKISTGVYDASIRAENVIERRDFALRLGVFRESEAKGRLETESSYNGRGLKTKHTYEKVEAESLRKLAGEIEYKEGPTQPAKKTLHEWSIATSPKFRVTSKLQTPFDQLKDFDGSIDLQKQGKAHTHTVDLKWNQNQKLKVQVKGDVSADFTNVDGTLQSTLTGLRSGQFILKSDFRTGRDFEARLDWNDVNKLRSFHKRTSQPSGDEKWATGVEATIPNTANYKASANIDWNKNTGKYKAITESQLNEGGAYKFQADFDTGTKQGTVEVITPAEQLRSAKAQVVKVSDSEYELKMVQNAQSVADVKATFKLEANRQKVAVEVKNIQKPFKTQFEHQWSETHFLLSSEINFNLADPRKAYRIKIATDTPDTKTRDVQVWLAYPARQLKLRRHCYNEWPKKFDWSLEFQSSAEVPATKFQIKLENPAGEQYKGGLHLTKGNMPGFHVEGKLLKAGVCKAFAREECRITGDLQVRYSADTKKHVTHRFKLHREIEEQRPKFSYEWQTTHQASNLQLKHHGVLLAAECLLKKLECKRIFEFGIEALNKQKQNEAYKFKFETDSYKKALVEVAHPGGKWTESISYDGKQITAVIKKDDTEVYEWTAGYNAAEKESRIQVKDSATKEVVLHVGAKRLSAGSFELQLWHSQNRTKVEDISVITALKDDSRVRSRLFVRPGFRADYGGYLQTQWERAKTTIGGRAYEQSAFAQLAESRQAIRDDVTTNLKPLADHWKHQIETIGRELNINLSGVWDLVNSFINVLRETGNNIRTALGDLVARVVSGVPSRTLQQLSQDIQNYVPEAIEKLKRVIDGIAASARELSNSFAGIIGNWRQTRDELYRNLRIDELLAYLRSSYEEVSKSPIAQKIIQFFTSFGSNLSWDRVKATAANLNQKASQAVADSRQQIEQQASAWRDELLRNEDTKEIAKFIQEVYNRLVWHLSRLGPSEKVSGFYSWITQEYRDLTSGGGVAKNYLPSVKESQPEKGIYIVEGPVPGQFRSFDEIAGKFQVDRLKYMGYNLTERAGEVARDADYALRDTLFGAPTKSELSPFRSHLSSTAILAGDQHFITFDDEVYDFAGECDYLLARDFENGEFAIFVSFERRHGRVARKSITLEYLEHKVEISHDNKVKVNDRETELPWHSVNEETQEVTLKVFRHHHKVIAEAIDGLVVASDGLYHLTRITVPKRYHAKSGGLLGINDFEPYNDLWKPDRKNASNVAEFARQWSTSASCAVSDNQAKKETDNAGPLFEECNRLFNSSSSVLRRGFHYLSPRPYLTICLTAAKNLSSQTSLNIAKQKHGLCNSAVAYIEACERQGITLELPSHCITCNALGTPLAEGETKRVEWDNVPNYADVVFIVEQRKAFAWTKTQLPQIAQKIDSDMKGILRFNTRFGLIGFNGDGAYYKPHFQTGQGALHQTLEGLRAAAGQLTFSERARRVVQDPLVGVKFAVEHFPFRAGARKLLVLFASNEECGSLAVDYFDLQSELLQMAINLQLLTTHKIELSNTNATEIIALDASTMYAADGTERANLRPLLADPHDSCTVLTQETNGTVISYSEKNLPAITELLTRSLVKAARGGKCQICECQSHASAPREVCFPCDIPRPASLTRDSTGFFNNPFVRLQKWQKKAQSTLNTRLFPNPTA